MNKMVNFLKNMYYSNCSKYIKKSEKIKNEMKYKRLINLNPLQLLLENPGGGVKECPINSNTCKLKRS